MFDAHLAKMDAKVLMRLGSPIIFLHGDVPYDAKAIPDGGESSSRFNKSSRRIAGCRKTLETMLSSLPPGAKVNTLKVIDSSVTYQVIDHDIDGSWVILYLSPVEGSQADKSNENLFIF